MKLSDVQKVLDVTPATASCAEARRCLRCDLECTNDY